MLERNLRRISNSLNKQMLSKLTIDAQPRASKRKGGRVQIRGGRFQVAKDTIARRDGDRYGHVRAVFGRGSSSEECHGGGVSKHVECTASKRKRMGYLERGRDTEERQIRGKWKAQSQIIYETRLHNNELKTKAGLHNPKSLLVWAI